MNEFLSALIGRAAGRLPVLERRPRSLFEPARGAASPAPRDIEGVDAIEPRAHASEPSMHHETPTARAQPWPSVSRRDETPPRPDLQAMHDARGRDRAETPAAPHAVLSPHQPLPIRPRGDAVAAMPGEPQASQGAREHDAPRARIDSPASPRAATMRPQAGQNENRAVPPPAPATRRVEREAMPHRATVAALAPARSPRVRPAVLLAKARNDAAPRHEAPGAAPPPAPVRISIGRVEIRAVQAPAERQRPSSGPAAPRLSLDDYLRGRDRAVK